ncbi:VanZ family protein [Phycicoccus badiiscoriae]|uniref:VanZ family protein n=1 Tax=Pedococcus badiiscoriae TaxID=642776 RepID=A0A852WG61_9MICO|nr:VanZ family protein [Pedococcus badiiscoriae]
MALSACIEITQAFGGAHDCTSTDTIANTTGALLGAGLAWIVMSGVRARSPRARTPTDRL